MIKGPQIIEQGTSVLMNKGSQINEQGTSD